MLILILTVFGCDAFGPPGIIEDDDGDEIIYTDVVYSPDGSSVTLYLEGGVPITKRQSRALSRELAIAGHDFFEVAFYYKGTNPSTDPDVIARASWELMKDAQVRGVKGKGTGESVNYSSYAVFNEVPVTTTEIIGYETDGTPIMGPVTRMTTVPALPTNLGYRGAAILFVGKKTDKTLLAVGRLISTDTGGTTIVPATKSVVFEVAAFDCGIGTADYDVQSGEHKTSFMTNFAGGIVAPENTNRYKIPLSGTSFDIFKLRDRASNGTSITSAEYHFRIKDADIHNYTKGIIVAGDGSYLRKQPRYPTANGQFQYFSVILDDKTEIIPRNNLYNPAAATTGGLPFKTPIQVSFNTAFTEPGSMFAFVFEIPVCPLYLTSDAGIWYIRSSYDSYWLNLDNSNENPYPGRSTTTKEAGGAVLLSTGTVTEGSGYVIRILAKPFKYLYAYSGSPTNTSDSRDPISRFFNVNGLLVALEKAGTDPPELVRYLRNDELNFEIGSKGIRPRVDAATPGDPIDLLLYGLQTVYVHYYHPQSQVTLSDWFLIIVDDSSRRYTTDTGNGFTPDTIPASHYIVIDHTVDSSQLGNYLTLRMEQNNNARNNTFVIIFTDTYGLTPTTLPPTTNPPTFGPGEVNFTNAVYVQRANGPVVVICVAARATSGAVYQPTFEKVVRVGRAAGASSNNNGAFSLQGQVNTFYFGKWPFNDELWGRGRGTGDGTPTTTALRYSYQVTYNVPNPPPATGTTPVVSHRTYNYIINAYGATYPITTPSAPPYYGTNPGANNVPFLREGEYGQRLYNVVVDPEPGAIEIFSERTWLY